MEGFPHLLPESWRGKIIYPRKQLILLPELVRLLITKDQMHQVALDYNYKFHLKNDELRLHDFNLGLI